MNNLNANLGAGFARRFSIDPAIVEADLRRRFNLGVNLENAEIPAVTEEAATLPSEPLTTVSTQELPPVAPLGTTAGETKLEPAPFYNPNDREVYLRGLYGAEESSAHNLSNFGALASFLSRTASGIGNVRGQMASTAVPEFVGELSEANRRNIDKQRQLDQEYDKAILTRRKFGVETESALANRDLRRQLGSIKAVEATRKATELEALTDPNSPESAMWRELAGTMMGSPVDTAITGAALKSVASPLAQIYGTMDRAQREELRRTADERALSTKLQAERESLDTRLQSERELLLKRLESSDAQAASKLRAQMEMFDARLRQATEEAERTRGFRGTESEKERGLKEKMQEAQLAARAAEADATRQAKAAADEAARKAKEAESAAEREFKGTEAAKERGLKRDLAGAQIAAKTSQDVELNRLRQEEAAARERQKKAELAVAQAKNVLDRKARLKIAADARASAERIAAQRAAAEKARGVKPGAAPKAPKPPATPKPGEQYKQIDNLRQEYQKTPVVKESQTIRSAWSRIQGAFKDPSAAGDLNLIFGYMKLLDPGSTVREGEFATAQNSGSAWNKIGALYNQVVSGERLTSRQRLDFQKSAGDLYKGQMSRLRETNAFFKNLAKSRGLQEKDLGLIGERKKIRLPSGFKGKRIAYQGVPYVWNEAEKVYEEEE